MNIKLYVVSISKPVVTSTDYTVQFRLLDADYIAPAGEQAGPMSWNNGGVITEFSKVYSASGVAQWEGLIGQTSDAVEFVF